MPLCENFCAVNALVHSPIVKKEKDVDPWLAKFDELDTNGDGVIDFDDAIEDLQKENLLCLPKGWWGLE